MSDSPVTINKTDRLKIVVLDDDRLSSHNLSIQLKFVGETPMVATSDNWQQMFAMLAQRNELANVLALVIGTIKGEGLADLLLQLHLHYPHLPILLLAVIDEPVLEQLPASLRQRLLLLGDKTLNYQALNAALQSARQQGGHLLQHSSGQSRLASPHGTPLFRSLSGDSEKIRNVRQQMLQVARHPVTVLIIGESGTGKEIVARNLHYHGGRNEHPFVVINCAAVAPERFDAELFGNEKGYGNSPEGHTGLLERADKGTLFLDEVNELPLPVQGKLLRFLEDKSLQRIGSNQSLTVDVRVVAGTRHSLLEMTRKGTFRDDLYYRLSGVPIELPSLRDRSEDIPTLVNELTASLEGKGFETARFNSSALQSLQQHAWPGNVRELVNLVERLGIMQPNAVLGSNDLPPQYRHSAVTAVAPAVEVAVTQGTTLHAGLSVAATTSALAELTMLPLNGERLQQVLYNFERQLLEMALTDADGDIEYAAERVQQEPSDFKARVNRLAVDSVN